MAGPTVGGQLNDARVSLYREAVQALRNGQLDINIPVGDDDDVSELGQALRELAETLKTQSEQSAMLSKITQRINEGLLIYEVLDQIYENFFSLIPYDRIGLALLDDSQTMVKSFWARSEAIQIKLPLGYSAGLAGSSLEGIIRTGRPRILNDLPAYLNDHPDSDSTRRIVAEGMRSSLTCPLVVKRQPIGFIFFSSMKEDTYSEAHQELFLQIADQLAMTLEKGRIYQELVETTEELREARDALKTEATRDSLTGLWNRRSILELLKRDMARSEREEKPLSAIMIDVDHFKRVNDRIGHSGGDQVLIEVTDRVASTLRSADMLGRIGGEEFLIILYPADEQTAKDVMERARLACASSPVVVDSGEFDVTISLGAAVVEEFDEVDFTVVLKTADHALYRAKEGGRNQFEVESV